MPLIVLVLGVLIGFPKDNLNQHENNKNLCNEKVGPFSSFEKNQWELRQQHDQHFKKGENHHRRETLW